MKRCDYCGRKNQDDADFCTGCGTTEFVGAVPATILQKQQTEDLEQILEVVPDVSPMGESALCLACLFPNLPDASWCKKCGAPIGAVSTYCPLQTARTVGFAFRGAFKGHPKRFVLLAIWLVAFPILAGGVYGLISIFAERIEGILGVVLFWRGVVSSTIAASMLYRVTRNYVTIPEPKLDEAGG